MAPFEELAVRLTEGLELRVAAALPEKLGDDAPEGELWGVRVWDTVEVREGVRLGVIDELGVGHKDPVGAAESVDEIVGVGEEDEHREGEGVIVCRAEGDPVLEGQ